jgi:hypothetical protein
MMIEIMAFYPSGADKGAIQSYPAEEFGSPDLL